MTLTHPDPEKECLTAVEIDASACREHGWLTAVPVHRGERRDPRSSPPAGDHLARVAPTRPAGVRAVVPPARAATQDELIDRAATPLPELPLPAFSCQVVRHDGVVSIELHGEIDLCARPALARAVAHAQPDAAAVQVDMAGVRFMDSSGVNFLWSLLERCRRSGTRLRITGVRAQPRRVLTIVGFPNGTW